MSASVPVLCFASGGVRFAVAVADVLAMRDDDGTSPTIATSLGLRDRLGGQRRVVTLATRDGAVTVAVHGPIAVRQLTVDNIIAPPAGVPISPTVLGFARVDGELIQLLAVDRVIAGLDPSRGTS